jgi:hypothetical protein
MTLGGYASENILSGLDIRARKMLDQFHFIFSCAHGA